MSTYSKHQLFCFVYNSHNFSNRIMKRINNTETNKTNEKGETMLQSNCKICFSI